MDRASSHVHTRPFGANPPALMGHLPLSGIFILFNSLNFYGVNFQRLPLNKHQKRGKFPKMTW